jgi:hypothetical protein
MPVGLTDKCNSFPIDSGGRSSVSELDEISSLTFGRAELPKVGEEGRDSTDKSVSGLPMTSESAILSSAECFSLSSVGI